MIQSIFYEVNCNCMIIFQNLKLSVKNELSYYATNDHLEVFFLMKRNQSFMHLRLPSKRLNHDSWFCSIIKSYPNQSVQGSRPQISAMIKMTYDARYDETNRFRTLVVLEFFYFN